MWRLTAACVLLALAAAAVPGVHGRRAIIGDAADACRAAWRVHRPAEVRSGAFLLVDQGRHGYTLVQKQGLRAT